MEPIRTAFCKLDATYDTYEKYMKDSRSVQVMKTVLGKWRRAFY